MPLFHPGIYHVPMSFSDTVFLFFLALILFGPKKLPEMARQAGRLLAELRRASNEFRSQIESEISNLEMEKKSTSVSSNPPGSVVNVSPTSTTTATSGGSLTDLPNPLTTTPAPPVPDLAVPNPPTPSEAVADPTPTTQESHV